MPPYIIINQLISSEELSLDEFLLSEATFCPGIIEVDKKQIVDYDKNMRSCSLIYSIFKLLYTPRGYEKI